MTTYAAARAGQAMTIQSLEGLWVLQTTNESSGGLGLVATDSEGRRFLLVFGDARKARNFMAAMKVEDVAPLLVCRAYLPEVGRAVGGLGVAGVIIDFDPVTGGYSAVPLNG